MMKTLSLCSVKCYCHESVCSIIVSIGDLQDTYILANLLCHQTLTETKDHCIKAISNQMQFASDERHLDLVVNIPQAFLNAIQ